MTTTYYETQEELDSEFGRIEEVNMEYVDLKESVAEAERELTYRRQELDEFEDEHASILLNK